MPIYEYRCDACGVEIEKLQKISDSPLRECPACGRASLSKKVSASSFRLKGGGWYETDFKTGNKKNGVAESTESKAENTASKDGNDQAASNAGQSSSTGKDPSVATPAAPTNSAVKDQ